jgi:hypothetical protein
MFHAANDFIRQNVRQAWAELLKDGSSIGNLWIKYTIIRSERRDYR